MPRCFTAAILAVSALLLDGCITTRPPERFPGLGSEDLPRSSMGMLREAENIYVESVDDQYITQYQINMIAFATYRQHLLPPGKHTLAVFYRLERNVDLLAAGPRYITMDVEPGHDYLLKSGLNGPDVQFVDLLPTANWRPAVIDVRTGRTVGIAPINR